jgi:purine-cytosine permease-like protein
MTLSVASCTWGIFLSAFSGSIVGWLVIHGALLLVEHYVNRRQRRDHAGVAPRAREERG